MAGGFNLFATHQTLRRLTVIPSFSQLPTPADPRLYQPLTHFCMLIEWEVFKGFGDGS